MRLTSSEWREYKLPYRFDQPRFCASSAMGYSAQQRTGQTPQLSCEKTTVRFSTQQLKATPVVFKSFLVL